MILEQANCYLLLGSNMGDKQSLLTEAIKLIDSEIGHVFIQSSQYVTAAWGKTDQESFLNMAIGVKTDLSAEKVLEGVLRIEKDLGRVRIEKWGERLIDIDIILYNNDIIDIEDKLQIPHPLMQERNFVMIPLAEIAPNVVHPVFNKSVSEMLENIGDNLEVNKI